MTGVGSPADGDRWARVQEAFHRVLAAPPELRDAELADVCRGSPELRAEVAGLVAADVAAGGFMREPAVARLSAELDLDARIGQRMGAYRLLEVLGQGGMGTVYLAERADEAFAKRVAIKLAHVSPGDAIAAERLRHERQIVACLEHPNIARLLDGGTTEAGDAYFVMEWVDGHAIDDHCRRAALDVRARVELLRRAAIAVSYAHQQGIVHRDLKPSNILVDRDGEPKLLDFGIAKLLDADPTATSVTSLGRRAMTFDYASPEQIRGQRVTTASDVYSLGVVLYELVTGRRPYDLGGRSPAEIAELVGRRVPPRPSTIASVPGVDDALDGIVLAALREDPAARPASVEHLRDALGRWLDGAAAPAEGRGRRTQVVVVGIVAAIGLVAVGLVLDARRQHDDDARTIASHERSLAALQAELDDVRAREAALVDAAVGATLSDIAAALSDGGARRAVWESACVHLRRAHGFWHDRAVRGGLAEGDAARPTELARAVERCARALRP